jgi:hypothetical protein
MQAKIQAVCGVGVLLLASGLSPARVEGANAYPLFTDPNVGGLAFGATDIFSFGANYFVNDAAQLNGNDLVMIGQFGMNTGGAGAGLSVPISNGENGIDQSFDGASNQDLNPDDPNIEPANSVFTTIGNPSGKLENGNVIRYSAWFRSDPANPITVDPQIQPVLKLELWKEALSINQDTGGGQLQPFYGDKVFDQDQHGGAIGIPVADKAEWIDFNGDGVVIDGSAAGEGRVSQISTDEWTLVESMFTVDDTPEGGMWFIGDDPYTVADIEEIRAVMFVGEFRGTAGSPINLTGDGDGGNMLVDNVLVEVFRDAASVTPNTNPDPALSEGSAGDFNGDGKVDAADYVVWRKSIGTLQGYQDWRSHYGAGGAGGAGGAAWGGRAVPEPSSAYLLVLLAASGMAAGRRHRG